MSLHALSWAIKTKTGSPTLKAILIAIANYCDEDGCSWPSNRRIADDAELSRRAVIRGIQSLEELGLLERVERFREDGSRSSNMVRLIMGENTKLARGGAGNAGGVVQVVHEVAPEVHALYEPSLNHQLEPKKDIRVVAKATHPTKPDRFQEFWEAYPRRDGSNPKAPARKLFFAAVKAGHDPSAIISGAEAYGAALRDKGQEATPYVAQAMTWLRQARWEDYQPEPVAEKTGPPLGLTEQQQRDWERGWRPGMPSSEELSRRVNGKATHDDRENNRSQPDDKGKLLASGAPGHAPAWV